MNSGKLAPDFPESPLVRAVGDHLSAEVEDHPNPEEIDHVRITMDAGVGRPVQLSISTLSKWNRLAGFDPRVRIGIVRGVWELPPQKGIHAWDHFDYLDIETVENVFYEHRARTEIDAFLIDRCHRARWLEVWGTPYRNRRPGIHQIHSRRASCAVAEDVVGRDGALKFYFEPGQTTELVLFKFCGQT
ncbi:MAG: hypothetical protein ACOYNN_00595 [Terrimicrobiaceae bacterium]